MDRRGEIACADSRRGIDYVLFSATDTCGTRGTCRNNTVSTFPFADVQCHMCLRTSLFRRSRTISRTRVRLAGSQDRTEPAADMDRCTTATRWSPDKVLRRAYVESGERIKGSSKTKAHPLSTSFPPIPPSSAVRRTRRLAAPDRDHRARGEISTVEYLSEFSHLRGIRWNISVLSSRIFINKISPTRRVPRGWVDATEGFRYSRTVTSHVLRELDDFSRALRPSIGSKFSDCEEGRVGRIDGFANRWHRRFFAGEPANERYTVFGKLFGKFGAAAAASSGVRESELGLSRFAVENRRQPPAR